MIEVVGIFIKFSDYIVPCLCHSRSHIASSQSPCCCESRSLMQRVEVPGDEISGMFFVIFEEKNCETLLLIWTSHRHDLRCWNLYSLLRFCKSAPPRLYDNSRFHVEISVEATLLNRGGKQLARKLVPAEYRQKAGGFYCKNVIQEKLMIFNFYCPF